MRVKRGAQAFALASVIALGLAACGSDDEGGDETSGGGGADEGNFVTDLTFGTGSTAGVYFPLGTEYANLFEKNIDGVKVNAIETDASVDNLGKIAQEEIQLGMTQNNTAIEAVKGEGEFDGLAIDNIGWLGQLYPEAANVITLEASGFESVEDLMGKKISIGPPGSGTQAVAKAILAAHGIEDGDYEPFEESFGDAHTKLQDGNIDASIDVLGVPAGSLEELNAAQPVKLLPIEASVAEQIAGDSLFEPYTIAGDSYEFLDGDVTTVSVFATVVASTTQVSEDLGYELTKVLYEKTGDITLAQKDLIKIEDALVGQDDVPLHPGAEKYFKEQGIL